MLAPALGSGVGTLRAAGIGLWVVALVANPMVLSLLLTGYSPFRDPFSNVTTGLLTVYLVAVGSWLIRRATQLSWADVVRFHLRLLLAAAVVEIGLRLLAAPLLEPGRLHRGLLEGPANRDQAWAAELFDEWLDVRYEYERFVGWRVAPMKRHHTNVDEQGRLTTQPSGIDESVPAIFFFGGSTMWGSP